MKAQFNKMLDTATLYERAIMIYLKELNPKIEKVQPASITEQLTEHIDFKRIFTDGTILKDEVKTGDYISKYYAKYGKKWLPVEFAVKYYSNNQKFKGASIGAIYGQADYVWYYDTNAQLLFFYSNESMRRWIKENPDTLHFEGNAQEIDNGDYSRAQFWAVPIDECECIHCVFGSKIALPLDEARALLEQEKNQ